MTDMKHMDHLVDIAHEDVRFIRMREATYQGSWKRRGGVGAFMMMARKWDRIENLLNLVSGAHTRAAGAAHQTRVETVQWDIFSWIKFDPSGGDGSILAEIRDLRRYLLLVEAEMVAQSVVKVSENEPIYGKGFDINLVKEDLNNSHTPEDGGHHENFSESQSASDVPTGVILDDAQRIA